MPGRRLFVSVGDPQEGFLAERFSQELHSDRKFRAGREAARMLRPQLPARLQEMVKMSERYICIGSSDFSPILNAAVGVVGVRMASTVSKALRKSCRINVRTFWARR